MLQPPDFDSRYKVLSQKRHLKILFGASGQITLKEMSRPERILKSAARKVSFQIAAWKLAWAEFGLRHPRMKPVPGWIAVFVFTGLGQSILGLLALFYAVAPWYVWPLTLFFSAALGEAFVIHYAGIAYERIKREEIEKVENENWLLMDRFYPELTIDYRPNQGEPFVQTDRGATQYRVSVRSPVETMAELVVNHVTISQRPKLFDVHLRPMHERDKSGTIRIKLHADGEMYWDLVSVIKGEDGTSAVVLSCVPFLGVMEFDPGEHEFELMTKGGDKPGATKIVTLQVGDDHTVTSLDIRDGRLSSSLLQPHPASSA